MENTAKRSVICTILFLLAVLLFTGCSMKKTEMPADSSAYQVTDAFGHTVTLPHKPRRILGTSSSIDTMLLGVVEPDRLVACFTADKDPAISYISEETKNISLTMPLKGTGIVEKSRLSGHSNRRPEIP